MQVVKLDKRRLVARAFLLNASLEAHAICTNVDGYSEIEECAVIEDETV